ncbi:MAG: beta-N-acetylhexosaminidase [Bacteroidales bacterium]|nr:beta-N-acetylhexosaminidase [Candidatus Physcousia equi]
MMKKSSLILSLLLCAASLFAQKADYNIVPLPRSIEADTTKTFTLTADDAISIAATAADTETAQAMERNAAFLHEYLLEEAGLDISIRHADKKAGIQLRLLKGKEQIKADTPSPQDAYRITVNKRGIELAANTPEGIFRAVQSVRKMLVPAVGTSYNQHFKNIATNGVKFDYAVINDAPRFAYRGQHLDCARHFFSTDFTKRYIDLLAMHGINQFHWHLTDDQGWRFEVKSMPELAKKACRREQTVIGHNCGIYDATPYGEGCYYTHEEMRDIVKYAAERYVNIIPEIDLPGHMVAALHVYPELGCTGGPYQVWPIWGVADDVLCVGNPKTLDFLKKVLSELCDVFPSPYIHIGGDESPRVRWKKCPKCQGKMKELGLKREAELQTYVNKELENFLAQRGRSIIGWDETLEGGLSPNAIVMSWRGYEGGIAAAKQKHHVIMTPTSHCYIDYYQLKNTHDQPLAIGGYLPMSKVYSMEPVPSGLTKEEEQYIMGPQCNLWTEYVLSPDHVEYMTLPRLAAMCEVQWLLPEAKDFEQFSKRLDRLQQAYRRLNYKFCRRWE